MSLLLCRDVFGDEFNAGNVLSKEEAHDLFNDWVKNRRLQLHSQMQTLHVVSPLATLGRGYSILLDERGHAIRNAAQTHTGQRLKAKLGEGELQVRVEDNHLTPVTLSLLD